MGKLVFNLITLTVPVKNDCEQPRCDPLSKSLGGFISVLTELLQSVFSLL